MSICPSEKLVSFRLFENCRIKFVGSTPAQEEVPTTNEPIIKPVDDWKVTIDGENVALPDTGDNSREDLPYFELLRLLSFKRTNLVKS